MNTTTTIEKMIDSIAAVCVDLGLRGEYSPEEIVSPTPAPSPCPTPGPVPGQFSEFSA